MVDGAFDGMSILFLYWHVRVACCVLLVAFVLSADGAFRGNSLAFKMYGCKTYWM
jgi:hypothetical protein